MAKGPDISLKEGDAAPAFTAATDGGREVSLKDLRGKHVVLFFYPKDDTPEIPFSVQCHVVGAPRSIRVSRPEQEFRLRDREKDFHCLAGFCLSGSLKGFSDWDRPGGTI